MRNYLFLFTLLFYTFISSTTQACYHQEQAEAEQAVRIHSELMVIGLSCIKMPNGEALYNKYRTFTDNNSSAISQYEESLISYFGEQGEENPEEALNNLRTLLANKVSQYAVEMSMQDFCDKYSGRLNIVEGLSPDEFRDWAKFAADKIPSTEPRCELN